MRIVTELLRMLRSTRRATQLVLLAVLTLLLSANLTPVVVSTRTQELYSFGWPVPSWWVWPHHGGRVHPAEAVPAIALVWSVNLLSGVVIVLVVGLSCELILRQVFRRASQGSSAAQPTNPPRAAPPSPHAATPP